MVNKEDFVPGKWYIDIDGNLLKLSSIEGDYFITNNYIVNYSKKRHKAYPNQEGNIQYSYVKEEATYPLLKPFIKLYPLMFEDLNIYNFRYIANFNYPVNFENNLRVTYVYNKHNYLTTAQQVF